MKCVHTETTAVLAAFGEAPPEFEHHLTQCAACRQAVSENLQTLSIIDPATAAEPEPEPDRSRWNPYATGFLAAAGLLLAFQLGQQPSVAGPTPLQAPTALSADPALFDSPLDDELAAIEMELALFNLEET